MAALGGHRGLLSAPSWRTVIGVAHETVASACELPVELVEHDVGEQRRERATLRRPLLRADHHSVWHHHLSLEHPLDQPQHPRVSDSLLLKPRQESRVVNPIEELLQVEVHYPLATLGDVAFGLGDGRLTTPLRPEAVARRVEDRLEVRAEHLMHSLLHDPVDHVRDTQASLSTTRLRNPHAA